MTEREWEQRRKDIDTLSDCLMNLAADLSSLSASLKNCKRWIDFEEKETISDKTPEKVIREKIEEILTSVGVKKNLSGYFYLIDCIEIVLKNNMQRQPLYSQVAEKNSTSYYSIDCNIKTAIQSALKKQSKMFKIIFGENVSKLPNGQFIYKIANFIDECH